MGGKFAGRLPARFDRPDIVAEDLLEQGPLDRELVLAGLDHDDGETRRVALWLCAMRPELGFEGDIVATLVAAGDARNFEGPSLSERLADHARRHEAIVPAIIRATFHADPEVRAVATAACWTESRLFAVDVIPHLARLLADPAPRIRLSAATGLRQFGTFAVEPHLPRVLAPLVALIDDPDIKIVNATVDTLSEILQDMDAPARATFDAEVSQIIAKLLELAASGGGARTASLRALGQLPLDDAELERALDAWRAAFCSNKDFVRFAACQGAKALGARAAPLADALDTLSRDDPDSGVRFMASGAVRRLGAPSTRD